MNKPYNGRDYLILKVIAGATKAGIEPDRKKEANKTLSRTKTKMNRHQPQDNGMMLAELKYLRAQVKAKDEKIAKLTEEVQELRGQVNLTAIFDPNTEENKAFDEIVSQIARDETELLVVSQIIARDQTELLDSCLTVCAELRGQERALFERLALVEACRSLLQHYPEHHTKVLDLCKMALRLTL